MDIETNSKSMHSPTKLPGSFPHECNERRDVPEENGTRTASFDSEQDFEKRCRDPVALTLSRIHTYSNSTWSPTPMYPSNNIALVPEHFYRKQMLHSFKPIINPDEMSYVSTSRDGRSMVTANKEAREKLHYPVASKLNDSS